MAKIAAAASAVARKLENNNQHGALSVISMKMAAAAYENRNRMHGSIGKRMWLSSWRVGVAFAANIQHGGGGRRMSSGRLAL